MRRTGLTLTLAVIVSLAVVPSPSTALPVSADGLVVTGASVEVQSVANPASWVATPTVYEGSPARLVLAVNSPGSGVISTRVSVPGVPDDVGTSSANVLQGATTLSVPLELSYGSWLTGPLRNTAEYLDVRVSFTPTPPENPPTSEPTPARSPGTSQTPTTQIQEVATPLASALPRPNRLALTGDTRANRRALRAEFEALPEGARVTAIVHPSRSRISRCPSLRTLTNLITSVAQSTGRRVAIRRGQEVRRGCSRVELQPVMDLAPRSLAISATTTFTVPLVLAPRPLILVHGMWSSADVWSEYTKTGNFLVNDHARWRGYAVPTMNTGSPWTPYASVNTVAQNAELAWTYIQDRMFELNAHEVDVLAHSMGGIITRRMLHDSTNGASARAAIRSVVLLGTPNGGSSCSEAWSVPANAELTHSVMETFNVAYPGYPGTVTTSLYSDHFGSTCFDANAGDLFVPSWSTQAQPVNAVSRIFPGIQHTNMVSDFRLFRDYVKPALALHQSPVPAGPTVALTNPNASSTRLAEGTATGARLFVTSTVTISSGEQLVATVVAPADATGTLSYTAGSTTGNVALSQVGDYPVFDGEVSYATLGGSGSSVTVAVTIDATTAASSEWRWSLIARR